jgi:tripartite motif-containing protein 2/3
LPRNGGIVSLPPSFIINQLIDLVKSRRSRDIIPRCVNHTGEELLYCETCDKSFCSICESHFTVATNADHIIIPFSIALKRITEIYLFKSSQCLNSFSLALGNVQREVGNLAQTVDSVAEKVEASFDDLKALVDKRKCQVLSELKRIKDTKTQVLNDQVKLIVNEKQKVTFFNIHLNWREL